MLLAGRVDVGMILKLERVAEGSITGGGSFDICFIAYVKVEDYGSICALL